MPVASWKQQYLENHARDLLEAFDQQTMPEHELKEQLKVAENFVFAVEVRQLLSHLSPVVISEALPNMTVFKVSYGVQRPLRMDYNRMLFGMQMPDATAWAQVSAPLSPCSLSLTYFGSSLETHHGVREGLRV